LLLFVNTFFYAQLNTVVLYSRHTVHRLVQPLYLFSFVTVGLTFVMTPPPFIRGFLRFLLKFLIFSCSIR